MSINTSFPSILFRVILKLSKLRHSSIILASRAPSPRFDPRYYKNPITIKHHKSLPPALLSIHAQLNFPPSVYIAAHSILFSIWIHLGVLEWYTKGTSAQNLSRLSSTWHNGPEMWPRRCVHQECFFLILKVVLYGMKHYRLFNHLFTECMAYWLSPNFD